MSVRPSAIPSGFAAANLPLGRDPASVRRRLVAIEQMLEGLFVIPGINRRVGLDFVLGLIPVAGDAISARTFCVDFWKY